MPQSSNLAMLETDLDNVFSAFHLPAYKSVCRSFIQVCNQIQKFNFRCQSVTITHWIMQEQTKRTSSLIISLKIFIKWYMWTNKTDKTMCYTLFFFIRARNIDSRLSSLIFSMVNQSQNVLILVLFEIWIICFTSLMQYLMRLLVFNFL